MAPRSRVDRDQTSRAMSTRVAASTHPSARRVDFLKSLYTPTSVLAAEAKGARRVLAAVAEPDRLVGVRVGDAIFASGTPEFDMCLKLLGAPPRTHVRHGAWAFEVHKGARLTVTDDSGRAYVLVPIVEAGDWSKAWAPRGGSPAVVVD